MFPTDHFGVQHCVLRAGRPLAPLRRRAGEDGRRTRRHLRQRRPPLRRQGGEYSKFRKSSLLR